MQSRVSQHLLLWASSLDRWSCLGSNLSLSCRFSHARSLLLNLFFIFVNNVQNIHLIAEILAISSAWVFIPAMFKETLTWMSLNTSHQSNKTTWTSATVQVAGKGKYCKAMNKRRGPRVHDICGRLMLADQLQLSEPMQTSKGLVRIWYYQLQLPDSSVIKMNQDCGLSVYC